jgi:hypothetical protein
MRFNEKHTCLEFLQKKFPNIYIDKKDWDDARKQTAMRDIFKGFNNENLVYNFSSTIQYMTEPFYNAYEKVKLKMVDIIKTDPVGLMTGTMIYRCEPGITKTIFYYIDQNSLDQFKLVMMSFTKGFDITALDCMIQYVPVAGTKDQMDIQYILGDTYSRKGITQEMIAIDFMLQLLFIKYCDTENKIVKPKEKLKHGNVKYLNETKSNIEILDSRWFTNIIREDPFLVSGHMRLQPYPSLGIKRWKYIKEYEKQGYRTNAKKSSNETNLSS